MRQQLNVRLPKATHKKIEKLVNKTGMTKNTLIILALDKYEREVTSK